MFMNFAFITLQEKGFRMIFLCVKWGGGIIIVDLII